MDRTVHRQKHSSDRRKDSGRIQLTDKENHTTLEMVLPEDEVKIYNETLEIRLNIRRYESTTKEPKEVNKQMEISH
jgi:hypothetical protein